jgi:hypothetical protein
MIQVLQHMGQMLSGEGCKTLYNILYHKNTSLPHPLCRISAGLKAVWGRLAPPNSLYLVCDPADTRQDQSPTLLGLLESAGGAEECLDRIYMQPV